MGGEASAAMSAEEVIRRVLIDQLAEAYRLAAFLLHDRTAAEDIVQEAALLAWERRRTLRDADRAEAWFSRIVVNLCRDELRAADATLTYAALAGLCERIAAALAASGAEPGERIAW